MATQISDQQFKNFFIKTVGSDKISHDLAKKFDIDDEKFEEVNENDNTFIEIDEVMDDKDLYEMFATMYVEEMEKENNELDKEKEKDEKNKVQNKSGAGGAK